jgi:hypothetical protein
MGTISELIIIILNNQSKFFLLEPNLTLNGWGTGQDIKIVLLSIHISGAHLNSFQDIPFRTFLVDFSLGPNDYRV